MGFKFFYNNVPLNSFWFALSGFRQSTNDKEETSNVKPVI
jgi:hypothetical protein